jgi:hypothetical protein
MCASKLIILHIAPAAPLYTASQLAQIFLFCAVWGIFIDYQWACAQFSFPLLPKTAQKLLTSSHLLLKNCAVSNKLFLLYMLNVSEFFNFYSSYHSAGTRERGKFYDTAFSVV